MHGLMQETPLMISSLLRHADRFHGDTEIVSRRCEGDIHRYTYREAHGRARRLANALRRLGVKPGDRVATVAWNGYRHFELYYAISGIGAIVHTVNPRLFGEQLAYIFNHAEDEYVFFDLTFTPLVEKLAAACKRVKGFIAMTDRAHMPTAAIPNLMCYEDLLAAESGEFEWPVFDENTAAALCYTSGTTGNPKGVIYSHRAAILQTMVSCNFDFLPGHLEGVREVMMPMAPLFHGNGWNMPFTAPYTGSKLVLPGRNY